MPLSESTIQGIGSALIGAMILVTGYQSVRTAPIPPPPTPIVVEDCIGDPIAVDYAYQNDVASPHECKVQCEDDLPRYILYSNGVATQCDEPPSCLDYGEDHGITCNPPAAMSIQG